MRGRRPTATRRRPSARPTYHRAIAIPVNANVLELKVRVVIL